MWQGLNVKQFTSMHLLSFAKNDTNPTKNTFFHDSWSSMNCCILSCWNKRSNKDICVKYIYIYNLCNPLLDQEGVLEITIPQYRLVDPNPRLTQALYRMATLMCTVYIILYYILAVVVPPATHSHSFQLPTLSSTFIISNSNKHIRPGWCFTFLIRTAAGHFWSWCAITLV